MSALTQEQVWEKFEQDVYAGLIGSGTGGGTGPAGPAGPTGPAGTQGIQGTPGAQGPAGTTGATGATGTAGTAGTNGTNGTNGVNSDDTTAVYSAGVSGTAKTLDWANGRKQKITLSGNCTLTFTGTPIDGARYLVQVITQSSGGPYTLAWPASVLWPASTAPVVTTATNKVDLFVFLYTSGSYLGNFSQAY